MNRACYAAMCRLARLSYGVPLVAPYDDKSGRGGNAGGQLPAASASQQPIWTPPQTPPKVGPRTIPQTDGTRNAHYSEYPPDWYAKDAGGPFAPRDDDPFEPANATSPFDRRNELSRDGDSRNRYAADPAVRPPGFRYAAPAGTHRYAEDVRLRSGEAAGYSSYPQDSFGRPRGVVDQIGMGDFTRGRFGYEEDGDADYARRRGPGR